LGILTACLGALSYIIIQREDRILTWKNSEKQHIVAQAIIEDLRHSMLDGRPRNTLSVMKSLQGMHGLVRLDVVRRDGTPSFGGKDARFFLPELEQAFATGNEIWFKEKTLPPLDTILFPLKNESECRACHRNGGPVLGVILISLSREDALEEIAASRRDLAILFSVIIAVTGAVLYTVIRKVVLKPLGTLHRGAEAMGRDRIHHRIDLATSDEFQDLADAFNSMAARLGESQSALERKVWERTARLREAMTKLQEKAVHLRARSRDMETVSRLSTMVFNPIRTQEELLDDFLNGVTQGLGYRRALVCLVDRRKSWLMAKRNIGMEHVLNVSSRPLASDDPFARLVRSAKVAVVDEVAHGAPAWVSASAGAYAPLSLYVIPILNRTDDKRCSETTSCVRTECPAYDGTAGFCWLVHNTLCGNPLMESYGNKLAYCMTCEVFPVIGVLVVAAEPRRRTHRDSDLGVLRIMAAEMGAVLENQRLHEENQRMVRELIELHRVTATALIDLSPAKALEMFADSALKFAGLDACHFWLVSDDGRELVRKAGGCVDPAADESLFPDRLPAAEGLLGKSLGRKSFVIEYNVARSDRTALGKACSELALPALFAMPLTTDGRPIGALSVHKRDPIPFFDSDLAAYMLLANQAAMAINVCTLNEELQDQNRALVRSTSLMSGILASMSGGVMLLDMDGRVKLINLYGLQMLRCREEDVEGRSLSAVLPGTAGFVAAAFEKADAGLFQEAEIVLSDGTAVPIGFSSTYYRGAAGGYEGVIVVFRDLSELKALQVELLNKERFAAMGRLVAGVAHEVRNPLFGISSIGQIFERELTNPAHLELVRALLSESRRLNQLVEDLLLYGRPAPLRLEETDLRKRWEEVLALERDELAKKGIRVNGDYGVHLPPVSTDPHQIRQVFLNLFRNALDATQPGGEITIRLLIADRYVIFQIRDTGAGIPAESLDKVFDLFFTTKPKGTGLGLAICKKIVEDHGGDITIESAEGTGTTVTVRLPYRRTEDRREQTSVG
jgi:signal transduction histidine kinase